MDEEEQKHGQDAHATMSSNTGVPPVNPMARARQTQGQNAHATVASNTGVSPVNPMDEEEQKHGQDAHATSFRIRRGAYLPHWTMDSAIYAVTFRLADSLPRAALAAWLAERDEVVQVAKKEGRALSRDEQRRLHKLHSDKVERYLDQGHGSSYMAEPRIAEIVACVVKHFDGERYHLFAWCVMPNHVHIVVKPKSGYDLPSILHSWKSFSAKEANRALNRTGAFWQVEYYDHLLRDEEEFWHAVEYVYQNPAKAGLAEGKWLGGLADNAARASRP